MARQQQALTVLHVEDDPALIKLVKVEFEDFGFSGAMISTRKVKETLELLAMRARNHEPISLILVDMQLPDGTGLDIIREVKSDPVWHKVPVVVLSSEVADGIINGAYALGANCYMPKHSQPENGLDSLQTLYKTWLEDALLPRCSSRDRLQDALANGVSLRARTSDFYLGLARVFDNDPEEMGFWLDRSLSEGNLSNLLAFFHTRVGEFDLPGETTERLAAMQAKVGKALTVAEGCLRQEPAPDTEEAYRWVLGFMFVLDEEVFAEVLGCLFPKGPVATIALKSRAAAQIEALAAHILRRTEVTELCQRAQALLGWAERLKMNTEVEP